MQIDRGVLGPRHPETATIQANLAGVLLDANAVDESVPLITEAISILEETLGEDHPRVAISASILAHGLRAKGDFARAEQNYRRAVAIDERAYGPKHPQTLDDVRTLAEYLRERGKIQEATALERRLAAGPEIIGRHRIARCSTPRSCDCENTRLGCAGTFGMWHSAHPLPGDGRLVALIDMALPAGGVIGREPWSRAAREARGT